MLICEGEVMVMSLSKTSPQAKPSWLGSREGITEKVLPPWTPLKVKRGRMSLKVSCWGRSYEFGGQPFPTDIETAGRSVLAAPIRLAVRVDGREQKWQRGIIKVKEQTPARVHLFCRTTSVDLLLSAEVFVEYDGLIRLEWQIKPRRPLRLDELTFEIPFRPEHAKYLYYFPDYRAPWSAHKPGAIPKEGFVMGFNPLLWLGDEERGLMWFCESDQNWFNTQAEKVTEVRREGNAVILRLRLVSAPLEMTDEPRPTSRTLTHEPQDPKPKTQSLSYTFGLLATPVKPILKDAWDDRIFHVSQRTFGVETRLRIPETILDELANLGVRTIAIHEHWTDIEAYTKTTYGDDLRNLVQACHKRNIKVLLYFGYLLSDLAPEWLQWSEECLVEPRYGYDPYDYPPQPKQRAFTVCYRSVWQDFLVDGIAKVMDEFDVDGVYLDGTADPWPCRNIKHGCGYERPDPSAPVMWFDPKLRDPKEKWYVSPDGKVAATFPIFSVRETLKRIYTVVKTRKPDGQVNVHQSNFMTPALAYATSYWDGEHLSVPKGMDIIHRLPLDMFRTEFMGHQWGVPAEFLHYSLGSYEQGWAFALPHDVPVRPIFMEQLTLAAKIWKVMDTFKRKEAEWLPYWRNGEYVTVQPEGAYVSLYRHPKNGLLAVVSNLSHREAKVTVGLNLKRLGLKGKVVARDALTGEEVQVEKGQFTITLGSFGWKILWVR
jgi:hypothetical protein